MIGKIFKAYDVRATYPVPLDEDAARKVGFAAGQFLQQQKDTGQVRERAVLVSRDMRPHSESLCKALCEGLLASGVDVIDLGLCDTSFKYFAINHVGALGGIQTTASHNPINYNGFKISAIQGKPVGADSGLKVIQKTVEGLSGDEKGPAKGKLTRRDLWAPYRTHVLGFLTPLKRKLRVFIDASNGMAGKMVPAVFDGVPNLEIVKLNFAIGGAFAHEPNPLVAANMKPTQDGVKEHQADLGACFDGDADRCILTDEKGAIIGCDHLTALLTHHFVARDRTNPVVHQSTIVYDLRSSKVVEETIKSLDAVPRRSRVGHVFMKALLRDTKGTFGGELSGHFYFRDNFYCDSGAIAMACVLDVLNANPGKTFNQLIAPFIKYPQSGEINFRAEDKAGVLASLKKKYESQGKIDDLDGVTIDCWDTASGGGFWFNVRASNTEPLLRLNAEAKDKPTLGKLLADITPMLGQVDHGH
ncbi:MAG: phosphomannomutase/phosphoglucomutase [Phycisphaeraceae bacterium]